MHTEPNGRAVNHCLLVAVDDAFISLLLLEVGYVYACLLYCIGELGVAYNRQPVDMALWKHVWYTYVRETVAHYIAPSLIHRQTFAI